MKEIRHMIGDKMGLHARPAGFLVKQAAAFPCQITIAADGREANAKNILAVMGLHVPYGKEIILRTDGEQEDAAIAALGQFLTENL